MSAIFTIGKSMDTEKPIHVRDAMNGLKCNCVCYDCNEKLEAVQGSRDWYFRHHNKSNCSPNGETALHEFAKDVLFENSFINTNKKQINYTEPIKEQIISLFRSDVSAKYGEQDLHFEVVVCNDLSSDKENYYRLNKINCIKIDLTDPLLLKATPEEITHSVLHDKINKSFIQWNEDIKTAASQSSSTSITEIIIGAIVVIGSFLFLRKGKVLSRRRSKKKR
jgi:hypothetical protein